MTPGRTIASIVALALAGAAGWWFLRPAPSANQRTEIHGAAAVRPVAIVPGTWPARSPIAIMKATPDGVLHFADSLNAPSQTAQDDVQLLVSLLQLYRNLSHGTNPVGDNAEITAALTGKNKLGYAFIRPDSPAINSLGELCDRWGTPFYFHQVSGTVMQVRSAGPDREHWTADDIVAEP